MKILDADQYPVYAAIIRSIHRAGPGTVPDFADVLADLDARLFADSNTRDALTQRFVDQLVSAGLLEGAGMDRLGDPQYAVKGASRMSLAARTAFRIILASGK